MKNLFKNLMLVAVAAMAFTACQNDNDFAGNAAGEGTTTISVVANLDDTRSAFTEKGEGETGYKSVWNGGEGVKAYVVSAGGYDNFYNVAESNAAVVEAENGATEAHFNLSFNSSLSNGALYIIAAADASVVNCDGTGYNYDGGQKPNITLPTEQTPGDNSVDPKAHILIYENNDFRTSQSTDIEATFKHYAAYGKLSLKNFTAEGVTSYVLNINGKMYTINSAKTENVWFACEPATVEDMTISVNTTDGTYTKKIVENSNPSLEFVKGQVSTFTVNMEGVTTGEAVDTFTAQYMASNVYFDASGDLIFEVDAYETFKVRLNQADRPDNTTILEGNYVGINSSSVGQGKFSVYQKINGGSSEGYTSTTTNSTMNVAYVGGMYQILVNYDGQWGGDGQVGYKGLPEGWIVPVEGGDDNGDEPENPGEGGGDEPVAELGSESNPYTFATFTANAALWTWTFEGAENGAKIVLGLNSTDFNRYVGTNALNSSGGWYYSDNKYTLNGTTYAVGSFGSSSEVTITANGDGSYNFKFKMVVNGGDPIWYVGTGR